MHGHSCLLQSHSTNVQQVNLKYCRGQPESLRRKMSLRGRAHSQSVKHARRCRNLPAGSLCDQASMQKHRELHRKSKCGNKHPSGSLRESPALFLRPMTPGAGFRLTATVLSSRRCSFRTFGDHATAKKSFSFQLNLDPNITRKVIGIRTARPAANRQHQTSAHAHAWKHSAEHSRHCDNLCQGLCSGRMIAFTIMDETDRSRSLQK